MSDDPKPPSLRSTAALDIIEAYLAGSATLEAAVRAAKAMEDDDSEDGPDVDVRMVGPDQQRRMFALLLALEEDSPDTA